MKFIGNVGGGGGCERLYLGGREIEEEEEERGRGEEAEWRGGGLVFSRAD